MTDGSCQFFFKKVLTALPHRTKTTLIPQTLRSRRRLVRRSPARQAILSLQQLDDVRTMLLYIPKLPASISISIFRGASGSPLMSPSHLPFPPYLVRRLSFIFFHKPMSPVRNLGTLRVWGRGTLFTRPLVRGHGRGCSNPIHSCPAHCHPYSWEGRWAAVPAP